MLDFERNISFQIQSDDFHVPVRRSSFLFILGRITLTEMSEYVVSIVIFLILKNYGKEIIVCSVFSFKIASIAQRTDEFPRSMVSMLAFRIFVRKQFITSGVCPRLIEMLLLFSGQK
jgi:hypothetical protein